MAKSIGNKILSAMLKTKTTRQHEAYQKYHKEAKASGNKKPLSFKMWAGSKDTAPVKSKRTSTGKKPKETAASLLVKYAIRRNKPKQSK